MEEITNKQKQKKKKEKRTKQISFACVIRIVIGVGA